MIGHLHKLERLKRSMFHTRRMVWQVSSVLKKFSVVRVNEDMIPNFKLHLQLFFKKIIKNKTNSITKSQYQEIVCEGREVCIYCTSHMVCSKFCLFKTKQKTPHFDAPKAYQDALLVNWKKYDDVLKMAQKYALPVQWKWYNELMTIHNSLSQDTGMESDVSYHDKDWFQRKI